MNCLDCEQLQKEKTERMYAEYRENYWHRIACIALSALGSFFVSVIFAVIVSFCN